MIVGGLGLPLGSTSNTPPGMNTTIVSVDAENNTVTLSNTATTTVTNGTFFFFAWPWDAVSDNAISSTADGQQFPNPYPLAATNTVGIDCSDTSALAFNVGAGIYINSNVGKQGLTDGNGNYIGSSPIGWNFTVAPLAINPNDSNSQGLTPITPQFIYGPNFGVNYDAEDPSASTDYTAGVNAPGTLDTVISQLQPGDLLYIAGSPGSGSSVTHVVMWLGQYATLNGQQVPLVISSHDNTPAVLDANGNMPPPGVEVLPFEAGNWFYENFSFAMRLLPAAQPAPPTPITPSSATTGNLDNFTVHDLTAVPASDNLPPGVSSATMSGLPQVAALPPISGPVPKPTSTSQESGDGRPTEADADAPTSPDPSLPPPAPVAGGVNVQEFGPAPQVSRLGVVATTQSLVVVATTANVATASRWETASVGSPQILDEASRTETALADRFGDPHGCGDAAAALALMLLIDGGVLGPHTSAFVLPGVTKIALAPIYRRRRVSGEGSASSRAMFQARLWRGTAEQPGGRAENPPR